MPLTNTARMAVPVNASDHSRQLEFTVCTLVSQWSEYEEMLATFETAGFDHSSTEFLYIDNTRSNCWDGFSGGNLFLSNARGKHVIICHQDVRLTHDNKRVLDARLASLYDIDPFWAVCGNAGCTSDGAMAIRISDPFGTNISEGGPFPRKVSALDENFLVVRRDANLGFSVGLNGFHLYAADLCANAYFRGMASYVIDFHLVHKSSGTIDNRYKVAERAWISFKSKRIRPRIVSRTGKTYGLFISGNWLLDATGNRAIRSRARDVTFKLVDYIWPS